MSRAVPYSTAGGPEDRLVFREEFMGANVGLQVEPIDAQQGQYNYLAGADPKNWHTGVHAYASV